MEILKACMSIKSEESEDREQHFIREINSSLQQMETKIQNNIVSLQVGKYSSNQNELSTYTL